MKLSWTKLLLVVFAGHVVPSAPCARAQDAQVETLSLIEYALIFDTGGRARGWENDLEGVLSDLSFWELKALVDFMYDQVPGSWSLWDLEVLRLEIEVRHASVTPSIRSILSSVGDDAQLANVDLQMRQRTPQR